MVVSIGQANKFLCHFDNSYPWPGKAIGSDMNSGVNCIGQILFRVKGIEKNQITKNRLNMTYHCKLLIHFKPFEPNGMMELKENIVAAAKLRDWRHWKESSKSLDTTFRCLRIRQSQTEDFSPNMSLSLWTKLLVHLGWVTAGQFLHWKFTSSAKPCAYLSLIL